MIIKFACAKFKKIKKNLQCMCLCVRKCLYMYARIHISLISYELYYRLSLEI